MVAGYRLIDRVMCLGSARLRTACIGAVYTLPEYRNQGLARALMLDAVDFATANLYDLLLLGGIRDFYHKFGYANMHAVTRVVMHLKDLPNIEVDGWSTHLAGEEDAGTMLDLYNRFFGQYGGCFERSLAMQRFDLHFASPRHRFVIALDPAGMPHGYIMLDDQNRAMTREVVADSWPATATLLRYHANFAAGADEPPTEVGWALPPESSIAVELIRHLSVKKETNHIHNGGWMARVASQERLMENLVPHWQEMLARSKNDWTGAIDLVVDDRGWTLTFDRGKIDIYPQAELSASAVVLTQPQFVQLSFGYPASLAAADGAFDHLPPPGRAALSIIFEKTPFWIAGSDGF